MPIRINLKEIFPSDAQEISSEKLNFNFNKLLELGIGTSGPIGLTGPIGPPGPIGLTGTQGIRGATWFIDSNDPNTHTFIGLLDGDLYLDNINFDVWQWDASTSTWVLEVGISTIINNYLIANGSPFVKTLGTSTKFIAFGVRNSPSDSLRGTTNPSLNNILYLNNFDETDPLINFPSNTDELYNSLLSISANHSDNQQSVAADLGRYHIELSSLYTDNNGVSAELSDIKHNLKIKFYKNYINPLSSYLPLTNEWINTAKFSLSVPEEKSLLDINQNSIFNFLTPKWNNESIPSFQAELSTLIGSAESHVEQGLGFQHIVADGITFSLTGGTSSINSTVGLAYNYSSVYTRLDTSNLMMLDTNSNIDGILLNNKTYVIGNTNVIGKISIGDIDPTSDLTISGNASIGSGYDTINAPTNGAIIEGTVGIGTSSPDGSVNLHVVGKTIMSDSLDVYGSHTTHSSVFSKTRTIITRYDATPPMIGIADIGVDLLATDHIVFMRAQDPLLAGYDNAVVLPSAGTPGRSICLQLISNTGAPTLTIKSVAGTINGSTTYTFPLALYTKRTFISDGFSNWYTEP